MRPLLKGGRTDALFARCLARACRHPTRFAYKTGKQLAATSRARLSASSTCESVSAGR